MVLGRHRITEKSPVAVAGVYFVGIPIVVDERYMPLNIVEPSMRFGNLAVARARAVPVAPKGACHTLARSTLEERTVSARYTIARARLSITPASV